MSETLETYAYNIHFHRNISLLKSCVKVATVSFMCFFLEYPKEFRGSCVRKGPKYCFALGP